MESNKKTKGYLKDYPKRASRWAIVLTRWLDIVLLAVVACLVYFLLRFAFGPHASKAVVIIGLLPLYVQWSVYSLIFAALWWFVVRCGGSSAKSFLTRAVFEYPPFWFACIFGIWAVWFIQSHTPAFLSGDVALETPAAVFFALGAAAIVAAVTAGCHKLLERLTLSSERPQKNHIASQAKPIAEDIEALLQWIEEEAPIVTPDEDILNARLFASRIAEVLSGSRLLTITVVGGYGAGKTSILNMVQHYLRDSDGESAGLSGAEKKMMWNRSVIPVEVCGWGLQRGSAAETILRKVIERCSQHVDCFGLSNLPAQYSASIGSVSSWSKALSGLLSLSYDPMATLKRIDRILLAIDKRVVVFFEDLDRNWQGNDFWVEIISLFDRLKSLERVSFVLAITETSKMGDVINRISDHVEVIPRLSVGHVATIYRTFKGYCLQKYNDIRFPENESRYGQRINTGDLRERNRLGRLMNVRTSEEIDAITTLTENPRNFKHILRRTYRAWASLHGEIDFDDLFLVNVLRVSAPEAFVFVHDNLADIRWLQQEGKKEEKDKERELLHEKLVHSSSVTGSKLQATKELIHVLFPYWMASTLSQSCMIQGVSEPDPTDYWDRLIRGKLDDWEISDQETAGAIIKWKEDNNLPVYKNLQLARAVNEIPGFSEKVKQFGQLLDGQEIRMLAQQLFEIVFQTKGVTDRDFPGRNELYQLALEKSFSGHGDWVIQEVGKLFPLNLSVAMDVYGYWSGPMFFDTGEAQRVRNTVLESAKSCYSDRNTFINAIKSAEGNTVLGFIKMLDNSKYGGTGGFKPDEWKWLSELLLNTAKTHGSVVIRQILRIVVTREVMVPDSALIWSQESCRNFFQERERDVMVLLSEVDVSQFEEKERQRILLAQQEAIKWISDNPIGVDAMSVRDSTNDYGEVKRSEGFDGNKKAEGGKGNDDTGK